MLIRKPWRVTMAGRKHPEASWGPVSQLERHLPVAAGLHPQSLSQCVVSHSWWVEAEGERDHGRTPGTGGLEEGQGAELGTTPVAGGPSVSREVLVSKVGRPTLAFPSLHPL